jgi:pyridoxal 5'-phosphate synthase pdxT subunit
VSSPLVGVLALQGDVREHVATLESLGARTRLVRRASDLEGLDGLTLPGGESTTISLLAVTFGLLEPLRAAITHGLPTYGSCAGMILLAEKVLDGRSDQEQFGGLDVVVRRNAFGRQVDSFEADVDVEGLAGGPVRAIFIRAPWVESVGAAVQVLATVEDGPAAGRVVAVRQGPVLATSFHPELTGDTRLHALFLSMISTTVKEA